MAKKRIFAIGFDLPGDEFEYVPFLSDRSLLDADIVLYEVGFGQLYPTEDYEGTPLFSKSTSARVAQYVAHWRSELAAFVNAGKLAIVFVKKPLRYFRYTGEKTTSGTGKSQVTTNLVTPVSSYDAVPNISHVEAKTGREVKLVPEASYLAPYWKELAAISEYEAFIEGKFKHRVLVTKSGDKTVGAAVHGNGTLLFLPPLHIDEKKFFKYDPKKEQTFWTSDGLKFGKRFLATLVALAGAVKSKAATPPPAWAQEPSLATLEESRIQTSIAKATKDIARLQEKRTALEQRLTEAGKLRALLYETGLPLEQAVREALTLLGFAARNYKESDSEFDVIFESAEGRFIGEVEGKDSRAVSIEKLDQLERNLREDFARDEITEFAKGVLFGNPERLTPPSERGEGFTAKCVTASRRSGIALVATADMFGPARYLRETNDPGYAAECRVAILQMAGGIVVFPTPPSLSPPESVAAESNAHTNGKGEPELGAG